MPLPRRQNSEEKSFLSSTTNETVLEVDKKSKENLETNMAKFEYGDYLVTKDTLDFLNWFQGVTSADEVLELLELGYIILDSKGDLIKLDCREKKLKSLERLPESLIDLDCSSNEIEELKELPSGLKKLRCVFNLIEQLDNLPTGLQDLDCGDNDITTLTRLPKGLLRIRYYSNPMSNIERSRLRDYCILHNIQVYN